MTKEELRLEILKMVHREGLSPDRVTAAAAEYEKFVNGDRAPNEGAVREQP